MLPANHDTTPVSRQTLSTLLVEALHLVADLRAELAEVRADRDVYREVAQQSIHALADITQRQRRQAERLKALRDELRRYTAYQLDAIHDRVVVYEHPDPDDEHHRRLPS